MASVYSAFFSSWLLGMKHGNPSYDFSDSTEVSFNFSFDMPYERAIEIAGGNIALSKDEFYRLSDLMKLKAFTVARLSGIKMVEKAQKAYQEALKASSLNVSTFIENLKKETGQNFYGWESYFNLVFRTNIQKDYNAGLAYECIQNGPKYLKFIGVSDERQSDICSERDGIVLPASDPFWDNNWPPLHFNCRSTVAQIFAGTEECEKIDQKFSEGKYTTQLKMVKTTTGNWGKNPALDNAFWDVSPQEQTEIVKAMIQEEINKAAGETVCKDFQKEKPGFINVKTERGGVRYPETMKAKPGSELEGNLSIAKELAEKEGYFVELREVANTIDNKNNRQADVWLNGVKKAEFKIIESNKAATIGAEIVKAFEQAGTAVVKLNSKYQKAQINELCKALRNNLANFIIRKSSINELIVVTNNKTTHIPSSLLTNWEPKDKGEKKGSEEMLIAIQKFLN